MPTNIDISKFIASLKAIQQRRHAAAIRGVQEFLASLLVHADARCPVAIHATGDTIPGELKASGGITPVVDSGTSIHATIQYTAPYAAVVHENLNAHHAIGQAKWLELTMRQDAPQLPTFILKAMEAA